MKIFITAVLIFLSSISFPQNEIRITSYNILNYPGSDTTIRNPHFRTVISSINPDILVVQEMQSQLGVNGFKSNILLNQYEPGTFINGFDSDNAIFYKPDKFEFVSNIAIQTALRDISQFTVVYKSTNDTLIIFSVHLKAGTNSSDEQNRAAEVDSLRKVTNMLPPEVNYIVSGDFNIYRSSESAYQKLLDVTQSGYFIDPQPLTGTWNNSSYAQYHTQSPRVRSFGGGATGGMDDRFDMILLSQSVWDSGGITYVQNSTIPYGNDGMHYNDSINRPPNNVVSQQIADALHYSSDHIPVIATFRFENNYIQIPVSLTNGWNILSVPLLAPDMTADTLFPTSISQFFSYDSGYVPVTILENGKGYWARFDSLEIEVINGLYVNSNELIVNTGWNLIGPFAFDVPVKNVTTIPNGILDSPFFGYNSGYNVADTLKPGQGYWVKASSNGVIQLNR